MLLATVDWFPPWYRGDCGYLPDDALWEKLTSANQGTFRPVCIVSVASRHLLFGWNADAHHITLLLLHLVASALVFVVGCRWGLSRWRSAFAAAVFGLGPIRLDAAMTLHASCDVLLVPILLAFAWMLRWDPGPRRRVALTMLVALLACWTKETAFIAIGGLLAVSGWWRTRRRDALAVAATLAAALATRTMVLSDLVGSYGRHQLHAGVGWRGPIEAALLSVLPFPELQTAPALLAHHLPTEYPVLRGITLIAAAGVAVIVLMRRGIWTEQRRLALVMGVAGLAGTLGQVGGRTLYLVGLGAAFALASVQVPKRRLGGVLGIAVVSLLLAAFLGRWATHREAGDLARGIHRSAIEVAGSSAEVYVIAAPARFAAAHSDPSSECFTLADPRHPHVILAFEGASITGDGPSLVPDADGALHVRANAGFRFWTTSCDPAERQLAGRRVRLTCVDGRPIALTMYPAAREAPPAAVWAGGGRGLVPLP